MAESELRQHLAEYPDDPLAHSALAISLDDLKRFDEAEQSAKQSISLAPDDAFAYYAMARVLNSRNRSDEAVAAIRESIRLEPADADYHGLLAALELDRRHWKEALNASETGLQSDPEHTLCNNIRAAALVKLGRKQEAGATISAVLHRNPEDAFSHSNQGWTLLEQRKRKEAMVHFRESLRLDPGNEWARAGLVEALKAGNPVYALFLRYLLWMQKLPSGIQSGIIIGGFVGNRFLGVLAQSQPSLAPWINPIRIAYVVFAIFTWLAQPIFNLMLFLHPTGRHALSEDQRSQATWVGLCLGMAVGCVGLWAVSGRSISWIIPAAVFGLLAIPVSAVHNCHEGWPRKTMASIASGLALVGLTAISLLYLFTPAPDSALENVGHVALGLFFIGAFICQWIAAWLSTRRPER